MSYAREKAVETIVHYLTRGGEWGDVREARECLELFLDEARVATPRDPSAADLEARRSEAEAEQCRLLAKHEKPSATWDQERNAYVCSRCGLKAYCAEGDFIPDCKCYDYIKDGRRCYDPPRADGPMFRQGDELPRNDFQRGLAVAEKAARLVATHFKQDDLHIEADGAFSAADAIKALLGGAT